MALLVQFLLRLTFGLAAGMAITSPKEVTSGYYRNHLYVTLGLSALAALLSYSVVPEAFFYCLSAAIASYVGAVCWLYESARAGRIILVVAAVVSLGGAFAQYHAEFKAETSGSPNKYNSIQDEPDTATSADISTRIEKHRVSSFFAIRIRVISIMTSGLLLGITMAAMLLGHWYLNTPTMELKPLYRLLAAMAVAVALQAIVSALGLWGELANLNSINTQWILFVVLRWVFGIVGVAMLTWMAWQTLKIPNTQSATGILYVAVIGTFVGETMALLLSAESLFPL